MYCLANTSRHKTYPVTVTHRQKQCVIGGAHPIVIQSMTNTNTENVDDSVKQVLELANAGSQLVRLTVNTEKAAQAIVEIRKKLDDLGCDVPLVGDFHYNGHLLLTKYTACAKALSKYRINPGNVGSKNSKSDHFATMIRVAIDNNKPVRIGVNGGSLDQALFEDRLKKNEKQNNPQPVKQVWLDALLESTLDSAKAAIDLGLSPNQVVLSCKLSRVPEMLYVYRQLAKSCQYALHVGLTEAGGATQGIVGSTAALAILLNEGIGDTIRVSLTPQLNESRVQEVIVAKHILQSLEQRFFAPTVTSCPGCGRTSSQTFLQLAQSTRAFVEREMATNWAQYDGVESLRIAVMGCVVNGPGESKHADIGISLPGNGEAMSMPVYVNGQKQITLHGDDIEEQFQHIITQYVINRYGRK